MTEPVLGKAPSVVPISNSELQTFKDCRRKWWLGYYRGLRSKKQKHDGPLPLGTRVHGALEVYYTTGENPVTVYLRLLEEDRQKIIFEGEEPSPKWVAEGELGRVMLEGYLQWVEETGADAQLEVVSAEQAISAPLFNGAVELRGKLDMRVRRRVDNVRLFIDHKTLANFDSITRTAHMSEQGMMYQLLETLNTGESDERCDGLIYNMLRKVKRSATATPPFYRRIEVHFNRETMRSFWSRIHGTIGDMLGARSRLDSGEDHRSVVYPRPTQDCTWKCEFFLVCPMFDDGSAAEEMVEALYEQSDPYARYESDKETR